MFVTFLGITLAAPIGPVNLAMIDISLKGISAISGLSLAGFGAYFGFQGIKASFL